MFWQSQTLVDNWNFQNNSKTEENSRKNQKTNHFVKAALAGSERQLRCVFQPVQGYFLLVSLFCLTFLFFSCGGCFVLF